MIERLWNYSDIDVPLHPTKGKMSFGPLASCSLALWVFKQMGKSIPCTRDLNSSRGHRSRPPFPEKICPYLLAEPSLQISTFPLSGTSGNLTTRKTSSRLCLCELGGSWVGFVKKRESSICIQDIIFQIPLLGHGCELHKPAQCSSQVWGIHIFTKSLIVNEVWVIPALQSLNPGKSSNSKVI